MRCLLLRVEHYKSLQDAEREFLALHFTHWTSPSSEAHTAVIFVDRYVNTYTSPQSSGLSTPSVSENVEDKIMPCSTRYTTMYLRWRFKSFKRISTMSFPSNRPSALEISILLDIISQQDIGYVISRLQSNWFCETVCKSLERLFQGVEQLCGPSIRWHLGTIPPVERISEEDINAVCDGYPTALQAAVLQMNQLEIQREAAREQIREEGRAEALLQNELKIRRIEQEREIEERSRQLEETRAENERMRVQLAALKDAQ